MRVFVIAGETSGDLLGAGLMAGLRELCPAVEFDGIGGPAMAKQGLRSRFPMEELSVMGLAEVLPRYFHLRRRISETARAVLAAQPDVLVTVDVPDFSLAVARRVKARSRIRTVHYVAPSVWAWRPGRATRMAKVIDHVLALLPFEPPYMTAAGIACDFVGHPVAALRLASDREAVVFRARTGLDTARFLLVLPGSRPSEISRLAPIFGEVVGRMASTHPWMRFVVVPAASVAEQTRSAISDWPVAPIIINPDGDGQGILKRAAFREATVALAASGTVSLELAVAGTPMVIAYRFNWITQRILGWMTRVDTFTLVNLVSETRAVPECLGSACRADMILDRLESVLADPSSQDAAMQRAISRLGCCGESPGKRAARAMLARLPGQGLAMC